MEKRAQKTEKKVKKEQKTAVNENLIYPMSSECEIPVNRCIIHVEGKGGVQKILTNETLKTILQRRSDWLELPEDCNTTRTIAATSLKFLSDDVHTATAISQNCKELSKTMEKQSAKNLQIKMLVLMKYG